MKKILKKMGYRKGELNNMDVKDIIELGKMGYSKEEIEKLKTEETVKIPEEVQSQIDEMNNKLEKMTEEARERANREMISTDDTKQAEGISDILQKLAYNGVQEK